MADPQTEINLTRQPTRVFSPEERATLGETLAALELADPEELADLTAAALGWFEDWLLRRDQAPTLDEQVAGLTKVIMDLRTRLAWIEAGADFTPMPEHQEASEAQVWASFLQNRPEHRHVRLEAARRQSRAGLNCYINNHEDRLELLTARCRRLEDQVRGLGGDPDA